MIEADSLQCTLHQIYDDVLVFNRHDESFRGKRLKIIVLQASEIPYFPVTRGMAILKFQVICDQLSIIIRL